MAHYNNGNGSSLADLERQAESTRAELAQTVDELQNRVTPDALKRDAKDYARQTGQQFLETIEAKARENPLAAVAVAAGLTLPLWRLVSSIPAPVLLVGAGLAMSRRSSPGGYAGTQGYQSNSGPSLKDSVSDMANAVGEKATNVIEDTQYKADVLGSRVTGAVADTAESAREMASDAINTVTEAGTEIKRQAAERLDRTQAGLVDAVERHPLLVGGLAFAVGGLIAASLPATRTEHRMMGSASAAVKGRAKNIADEGVEAFQNAAGEVYQDVASQAKQKGLTPDVARSAVRTAVGQAGTAIDKAKTASGSSAENPGGRPSRKHKSSHMESDNG
jgi:ElaB/YqjD/DUF883 family membrane-anchored ribosome-binding protein